MDAKVRDALAGAMKTYTIPGLILFGKGEIAYAAALRQAQEITGGLEEARETEHYYAPIPGDREGWCAVCSEASTHIKHRGSSSAAKDFIIGAFELYTQIMRYHGERSRLEGVNVVNATDADLMLDCSA